MPRPMIFEGTPYQNGEEESKARDAAKTEEQSHTAMDMPLPCDVRVYGEGASYLIRKGKPWSALVSTILAVQAGLK